MAHAKRRDRAADAVRVILSFVCAGASACGGNVAPGSPLNEGGASDARQALMDTGNTDTSPVCPPSRPSSGGVCTDALTCEYGDDPLVSCDTMMACVAGAWTTTQEPAASGCSTTNPPSCPATLGVLMSGDGCASSLACYYPEARCTCGTLVPGAPVEWLCDTGTNTTADAAASASCPAPRPRLGTACAEAGLTCDYGRCQYEDDVLACTSGIWLRMPASTSGCPL
jgi:hypothetical protein